MLTQKRAQTLVLGLQLTLAQIALAAVNDPAAIEGHVSQGVEVVKELEAGLFPVTVSEPDPNADPALANKSMAQNAAEAQQAPPLPGAGADLVQGNEVVSDNPTGAQVGEVDDSPDVPETTAAPEAQPA